MLLLRYLYFLHSQLLFVLILYHGALYLNIKIITSSIILPLIGSYLSKVTIIISATKNRSMLWKEKFHPEEEIEKIIDRSREKNDLIDDVLLEGFAFQKRKSIKPAGKVARQLTEELLFLLDNDANKAEAILKTLVNFNVDHSIEWYLEKAVEKVLKEKNSHLNNSK